MPKRKAVPEFPVDDSDLSPPPNDLKEGASALINANADLDSEILPNKRQKTTKSAPKSGTATKATNGAVASTPKRATRTRKVKVESEEEEASEEAAKPAPKKRQSKARVVKEEESGEDVKSTEKPAKKKRKTKEEKEAEAMPLAARTVGHKLFIGAHVSSAGGQCFRIQLHSTPIPSHSSAISDIYVKLTIFMQVFKMHH